MNSLEQQVLEDFGDQWQRHGHVPRTADAAAFLRDVFPDLDVDELKDAAALEIGSGSGRFATVLLDLGVGRLVCTEPSRAFDVLVETMKPYGDRVSCRQVAGADVEPGQEFGFAFAAGVLHHIPDPLPTAKAACDALRPGGRFLAWFYGREHMGVYLAMLIPLRAATTRLPHAALAALVRVLDAAAVLYAAVARVLPLPLRRYMRHVFAHMPGLERRLLIYDQLRPRYAKYYTREEVEALIRRAGFEDIQLHHRHGYSWSVVARKPM